ncbi:MAG: hypothetical protein MMC23_006299 [Stictis urceolatum]|nr:hypothetical protein [Stictis urceolata]
MPPLKRSGQVQRRKWQPEEDWRLIFLRKIHCSLQWKDFETVYNQKKLSSTPQRSQDAIKARYLALISSDNNMVHLVEQEIASSGAGEPGVDQLSQGELRNVALAPEQAWDQFNMYWLTPDEQEMIAAAAAMGQFLGPY